MEGGSVVPTPAVSTHSIDGWATGAMHLSHPVVGGAARLHIHLVAVGTVRQRRWTGPVMQICTFINLQLASSICSCQMLQMQHVQGCAFSMRHRWKLVRLCIEKSDAKCKVAQAWT